MDRTLKQMRGVVDAIPFVDTHSHVAGMDVGTPVDDRAGLSLAQVLFFDYLLYVSSACGQVITPAPAEWKQEEARERFVQWSEVLDRCRSISLYTALREGVRELHPFDEEDITEANFDKINASVVSAYQKYGQRAWHRMACDRVGIVHQNQMVQLPYVVDHWAALPPEERRVQQELILPSLILDGYLFSGWALSTQSFERSKAIVGIDPTTHGEHLTMCERVLDRYVEEGGASVKLLLAYHRMLRFEDVPDSEAERLYAKGPRSLDRPSLWRLQDNLVRHLLRMSLKRGLPLIVHNGYAIPSAWGNAEDLLPVIRDRSLAGLKIDVCHSNWPNEGGAMILARTYRHVYFNLCWTPLMSPALGRRILSEAIDIVPMNKILIGTDCATVESMVGAARCVRKVMAEVLAAKVRDGDFNMAVAERVARCVLHENAVAFYAGSPRAIG